MEPFVTEISGEEVLYEFTFSDPDNISKLRAAIETTGTRDWITLPVEFSYDLGVILDEAMEKAGDHFQTEANKDFEDLLRWDNSRISRGLRGA